MVTAALIMIMMVLVTFVLMLFVMAVAASITMLMLVVVMLVASALAVLALGVMIVVMVVHVVLERPVMTVAVTSAMVVMVVATAVAFLVMLMVMVVTAAVAFLVMMVMVMLVALALLVVVVMVMLVASALLIMMMIVASALAFLSVLVVMVVVVVSHILDAEVHSGILHGVLHDMFQLVSVHVRHGGHEAENDLLLGRHGVVVDDALLQIGQVEVDSRVPAGQRHLNVSQEHACLLLHPFSYLHYHLREPELHVIVETVYVAGETYCGTVCLLYRCCHIPNSLNTRSRFLPVVATTGMTFLPGISLFIHSMASFMSSSEVRSILFSTRTSESSSCFL